MKANNYDTLINEDMVTMQAVEGGNATGENALNFIDSLLTTEEIVESDCRVSIIRELIKARKELLPTAKVKPSV